MTTLADAKTHLRVMHDQDDQFIEHLIDAAEEHIQAFLGATLPDPMPTPIQAAVLLLVGDLYENRTRQADRVLYGNNTYELLLNPYRSAEVL